MTRFHSGFLLVLLVLASCHAGDAQRHMDLPVRPGFLAGDTAAAWTLMTSLSMRERVAQLMMVPLYSRPDDTDSFEQVQSDLFTFRIGGVIAMQGDKATTRQNLQVLDSLALALSGVGMLTSMDAEWGAGMRLTDGLAFPKAMALGATADERWVRAAGRAAGEELRALGVGIDFAPVADVNSNPENPVIGNRSFGSDPSLVGNLASAWAEGLREAGVLAVGKHFPGHGDADLDSHHALPLIASDSATLANVELPPFSTLIHKGVDGIMTAHLQVPALDSVSGLPTSLSPSVVRGLLREEMGFEGLVFTDALTMAGAAEPVPPGTREVAALLAGNDVLLFPSDPGLVLDSVESALSRGVLDTATVNAACLRVLLAKQWTHLPPPVVEKAIDLSALQHGIREAMLVRLGKGDFLEPGLRTGLLIVGNRGEAVEARLRLTFPDLMVSRLGKQAWSESQQAAVLRSLEPCDQVVLAFLDESNRPARRFGLPKGASALVSELARQCPRLFTTLFTSPYALGLLPEVVGTSWMVAHHEDAATQTAAMAAWCGEGGALGRLPVDVGSWKAGQGHPLKSRRLPRSLNTSGFREMGERLDSLANAAIALSSTPGMRILVVASDTIRYDGCHGHLGDSLQTPVARHHLYDLASITKVATSTTLAMMTVERGMMSLDQELSTLLPPDPEVPLDPELGKRTLRDLLAHRSGLPAWIPFYLDLMAHEDSIQGDLSNEPRDGWIPLCEGRCMNPTWCDSIRHTIRRLTPDTPGTYRYSDLGYYLLQDVLEHLWNRPLDQLADSLIHRPLGLERMGYHPLKWCPKPNIAPTEVDTLFRKGHIRGTVHDPGAAMMGGVAGHAGLFSDAHDLALLMELMRKGGEWGQVGLVEASTLADFSRRAYPEEDNRRGTGWDKPGLNPDTGASGNAGSWDSFGHSGFTGTLAWTDPEREWTVVILGNRICPDAENRTYIEEDIRTKALVIVEQALGFSDRFTPEQDGGRPRP